MSNPATVPPHDPEAERACLGAAFLELGAIAALLDAGLTEDDFYAAPHKAIFTALKRLYETGTVHADGPIDIALLKAELRAMGAAAVANKFDDVLFALTEQGPNISRAGDNARTVRELSRRRALIEKRQRQLIDLYDLGKPLPDDADASPAAGAPVLLPLVDVKPEAVSWLWPGRVPLGKLTILTGDPGLGKSFLTLDMAARISRGLSWPDADGRTQSGNIIILSAEDDPADTIRPRLDAAGADAARITMLKAIKSNGSERMFSLRSDIDALRLAVKKIGNVRLIVIDPLTAYLDGVDSHKNADIRGLLAPLATLAADCGCSVVGVSHLSKNANSAAIYRTLGSLAFVAAARAVWALARDKEVPERRLFLPVKQNLARDNGGLAFSIVDNGHGPVLAWEQGRVDADVDDVLTRDSGDGDTCGDAENWLRDALADAPLHAKEIIKMATENGIATRTLYRAKARLRVASIKVGIGDGTKWLWALPTEQKE